MKITEDCFFIKKNPNCVPSASLFGYIKWNWLQLQEYKL